MAVAPPNAAARARAAADGAPAADAEAEGWEQAERARARIVEALHAARAVAWERRAVEGDRVWRPDGQFWVCEGGDGDRESVPPRSTQWALRAADIGGSELVLDGRWLRYDWRADPVRTATKLDDCSRAYVIARANGAVSYQALGCGDQVCPHCARVRASHQRARWEAVISHLQSVGYTVLHVTLTRRPISTATAPVVLTDAEHRRRPGVYRAARGELGAAAYGAPLGDEVDRTLAGWRRMVDDRRLRSWWRSTVAGTVRGLEWTTQPPNNPENPRYHAHIHALVVLYPGVEVGERSTQTHRYWSGWAADVQGAWCSVVDATRENQAISVVDAERGLAEVLKYPFKPSEATVAQIVESIATMKGRRCHQVGGAFHSVSTAGAAAKVLRGDP